MEAFAMFGYAFGVIVGMLTILGKALFYIAGTILMIVLAYKLGKSRWFQSGSN